MSYIIAQQYYLVFIDTVTSQTNKKIFKDSFDTC